MRQFATNLLLGCLVLRSMAAMAFADDWSQFRGQNRDGISKETGLIEDWDNSPPKLLWTAKGLGKGYASVSVVDGVTYTTGEENGRQFVLALDSKSSEEPTGLWKQFCGDADGDAGYPGSRSTPTLDGERLYVVSTAGDLACLDRNEGTVLWSKNLVRDFGGRMMSGWGFSESPLIDEGRVVVTPGADDAAIVALDKTTGEEIWRASVPDVGGAGYASVVVSEAGGVRQYLTLFGRGLVSVAADDGRFLWRYERIANGTANIPSPVVRGDYVFTSTGYDAGAALLHIQGDAANLRVKEVYFLDGKTFQNHHGGFVLIGDCIYAGSGHNRGSPTCLAWKTGKVLWKENRGPGDGSSAVIAVDGKLYYRYQDGRMALVDATPARYRLCGTFDIPDVEDPSWPHPAFSDGRLYLREQDRLYCYDCQKSRARAAP